jgi:hypothetical protein
MAWTNGAGVGIRETAGMMSGGAGTDFKASCSTRKKMKTPLDGVFCLSCVRGLDSIMSDCDYVQGKGDPSFLNTKLP